MRNSGELHNIFTLPLLSQDIPIAFTIYTDLQNATQIADLLLSEGVVREEDWEVSLGFTLHKGLDRWWDDHTGNITYSGFSLRCTDNLDCFGLSTSDWVLNNHPEIHLSGIDLSNNESSESLPILGAFSVCTTYNPEAAFVGEAILRLDVLYPDLGLTVYRVIEEAGHTLLKAGSASWVSTELENYDHCDDDYKSLREDLEYLALPRDERHPLLSDLAEDIPRRYWGYAIPPQLDGGLLEESNDSWKPLPLRIELLEQMLRLPTISGEIKAFIQEVQALHKHVTIDLESLETQLGGISVNQAAEFEEHYWTTPLLIAWNRPGREEGDTILRVFDDYVNEMMERSSSDICFVHPFPYEPAAIKNAWDSVVWFTNGIDLLNKCLKYLDSDK